MAHWQGHTDHLLKEVEKSQAKRDAYRYEMSLTKWFKRRRACIHYCKKNILYYIAGSMLMRGLEPLTSGISISDIVYKHAFVGNMILITIAAALAACNLIFNAKENR